MGKQKHSADTHHPHHKHRRIHLTVTELSALLHGAKVAHTDWEGRFKIEGSEPPEHNWEDWYAAWMLKAVERPEDEA